MNAWLYQMNTKKWTPEEYQDEVAEGEEICWPTKKITNPGGEDLKPGDLVIFFFTRTSTKFSGLYGWAEITDVKRKKRGNRFSFQALPPSDILKRDPIHNDIIHKVQDRVRRKMFQGTMWPIATKDFNILKHQIRKHES